MLGNLAKVGLPIATNLLQSLFAKKGGWNPEDIDFDKPFNENVFDFLATIPVGTIKKPEGQNRIVWKYWDVLGHIVNPDIRGAKLKHVKQYARELKKHMTARTKQLVNQEMRMLRSAMIRQNPGRVATKKRWETFKAEEDPNRLNRHHLYGLEAPINHPSTLKTYQDYIKEARKTFRTSSNTKGKLTKEQQKEIRAQAAVQRKADQSALSEHIGALPVRERKRRQAPNYIQIYSRIAKENKGKGLGVKELHRLAREENIRQAKEIMNHDIRDDMTQAQADLYDTLVANPGISLDELDAQIEPRTLDIEEDDGPPSKRVRASGGALRRRRLANTSGGQASMPGLFNLANRRHKPNNIFIH